MNRKAFTVGGVRRVQHLGTAHGVAGPLRIAGYATEVSPEVVDEEETGYYLVRYWRPEAVQVKSLLPEESQ